MAPSRSSSWRERPERRTSSLPPPGDDGLLAWYRALACYDARLYVCARERLAELGRAGPRAAAEAEKVRAEIARVLSPVPATASIDWYLSRCEERRAEHRLALAAPFCREAAALGELRPDRYGVERAAAQLARLAASGASGARR